MIFLARATSSKRTSTLAKVGREMTVGSSAAPTFDVITDSIS